MTIDFITQEKDYWVASNAINITLNALSDPNRIQCSVSSGAVVRCFYEHIDEADSLGYTVSHDYHQWPISSSPTYFNSNTEKYVYIAIPRSAAVGVQAIVVFPSDKLDIYGRKAVKSTDPETGEETIVYEQIGSMDYFYVWLQATISAPLLIDVVLQRIWTTQIATGKLDTPQGDAERETDSEWYLWSAIGGFVTFLREIRMSVDSWFANIRLGKDKRELTGVATADTSDEFVDSETLVVTPSYLSNKFLRKDMDDSTPYSLGVGEDLTVGGDVDVTGQERVDVVQSHNYSGSGLADTGFLITNDNGSGDSLGVFDYLTVRKKMIINSLEIKETHFSAGDVAHTLASAEIARTDYFYVDEEGNRELLGYSTILVPWSLKGGLLALAKGNLKGIFGHYKKVRLTLTQSQLERCNRIRCYFLAKDGEREVENWFRANDLVRCQTWNVLKTKRETFIPNLEEHDGNVYWWRKLHDVSWNTGVTRYVAKDAEGNPTGSPTTDPANAYVNEGGVKRLYDNGIYHTKGTEGYDDHQPVTIDGNTYHWFDVDYNYFSDESVAAAGSDIPAAGDKVIQFGNTTDPDRMNIYMIEVNGAGNPDAPDWKMYRGVYTFNLTNCWWGGESCRKTKWSVATGIEAYAPQFNWITEYGIARQVFVRDEVYWNKIPFERDDDWSKAISSYPDYSDDIVDANGHFVSRADGSPKNYVRKCRYYEQVSHNGSAWLCSVVESFYWRSADGRKIPAKTDGAEYVRNYTYDEPSAESNNWTEQVEKGDPGAFKSTVFCRSNSTPAAPSNDKKDGCNTFDNPVPPVVSGQPTWTDGIPDGTAILWASTAWFYSDGTHQNWTTPRQQTDTETLDVEFSPNASQPSAPYGTAANKDTASTKEQRHSQGWYDPNDTLPSGVTWSDMKWRAERKIKNGVYYGSWAITRIKGENSVRIDLDNENDSMLYTSGGTLVSGNVLSTARLFDGATDVSTSATWTMTAVGCTMSSGNSRNIVVTGMTAATGYVNVQAVYTDKNGTVYTKTTRLTLKKLVDVDKYDLDITPNSIAYNATKDQPATSTLTIKVWKMTVDGNRVLSDPPSGYGVYVNNAKQTASSTGTYSYTTDNSAISSVQVKIAKDADLDAILDSETIPVNKAEDGAPGTSPYFADIDNEMDSVACDKNGNTLTAYDTTIGVSLWHGSHPLDITTLTTDSIQGFTITPDKNAKTIRIQVAKGTSIADVNKIGITIAGSGSGNLPLHFVLNGVRQGENGEPAVLYSLVPSVSSVVKKKDGTYSVDNVSCTRQKNVGGTITNNTTDGAITYKLDGGTEKAYTNNTDIAVTSFTKSIQFIFKVDGKVVDIETIPMVADGVDGVTPTVAIVDGYWVINGQSTGVKAEGTDGTGVEIKGTVASPSKMTIRDGKGYAIPMNSDGSDAPEVEVKHGDCYICNSDRHLYMFTSTPAVAWNDLGEFQGKPGEPGKSSYMHIAYAKKNPLNVTTATVDTIGFTVNSDGSQYEWMGFCTDDKESDPGRNWGSLSPSQKVAAVNAYKWNYMKGKDGSGYEYIYLLTKEGFKPTIDESSGQGSQSDDEFYPSVGNYQDGKIYDNSRYWNDDPPADISETWPILWWASRKKSDGVWQAFGSVDLHNRYAKDGTSPWIADLDNEMDSVACDNDCKPVVQQAVSTNVSLFYGSQKKAFITSVNGGDTGITISFSNKTAATAKDSDTVTITFATNAVISGKKEFEITLTAKDDASIQRVLTLTVNGLKGGATYNLVPSDSFVLLNKANQYVPSVLTCTYNKFDVAKGQFVTPAGGTVKYIKDGETAENAYKQLVPGTDFTNNVTFLLYVGTTLVDRETIHIVKDGTDGLSAQSYIETQEAWSNQETTASADTMPSDCQEGDWKDSTPANTNSRTYLWRRSRKMTLKTDKSGYDAGQWSYTRLSGTNGTSIKTQGTVANTSKLLDRQVIPLVNGSDGQRTDVQDGWAYISEADRHLYQWSDELRSKSSTWVDWRSGWLDLGEFKGESGKTYYTHIAWAKGIILKKDGDGRAVTTDRTAGQRTMPNAVYPMTAAEQELFDFSIAPQEDLTWMGTLVDEDTNDAPDYKYYTWKYVQGADGKNAVRIDLDNQADLVSVDADGKVRFARTVVVRARIFDGASIVTDDDKVSHSMTKASMKIGSREPSSIVKSNGVVTVQWDFSKGDSVTEQTKTFTLNYGGQGYSEEFTLGTTKSDVIYQLLPSPSEVSFSKGSDGKTLTPAQINLYGGYVKENGGAPVTVQQPNGSQIDSSNYLYYRIKGADGAWGAWTAYPASPNNFLQVASSTTNTDIEFCISTAPDAVSVSDSNVVDRENVPIVKDGINGDKGENSIRLALDNEHEDFLYNASGELVAPAGGATSQARLYDGALQISANSVTWAVDFSKSSGVPTAGQNAPTCVNGLLTVPHVTGTSAKVAVKATYDRKDYFAEFTANKTEGDKYDIVVKPNAIPYNSSEAFTEKTINLSVKGIDAQGHNIDSISIDTSATPSAGKFCVFWGYVNANGSVGTLANLKASSKKVTAVECNTYAGIYFELRRYSDSTNYRLCDYETVEIAKVQNGDSNLIVDLDNESDQFGTDSNDMVQGDAVRSTGVSLYYGSERQEFLASGGLTAQLYYASDNDELHPITNGNIATVGVSYSGATGTVTVTVKDGATIADSGLFAKIVAKCAKDTTGKVAYFNLGKVKSGEPGKAPDICNLRPTSKSISFNKSELAGSTPKKLGCGYTLIKDSVTTNAETAESVVVNGVTYYIYWRYVGGTYARFTTSSAIWATGILPATSEKGVEFCLSSADTASGINTQNTLDAENVPIIKDGINGSATFHEIQSSQASVIVGAESTQAVINANFIFRLNTSGVYSAYSCYYAVYRRKGGAYTWMKSSSEKATTGSYSETENDYTKVDAFVVVMSDAVIETANALPPSFLSKLEIPVEKQGGQGPQGAAAWAFSANPANVIITQSLDDNLTSFSSAKVSFAAKKGSESATITSIAIPTGQQALSNEFNATIGTGDDAKKVIVSSPKTHGSPAEYYTEGSFKVVVNAQAPDGSTSSQEVTVLCYANLLGTWKRAVVGDAEAVAAAKVAYIYDPNNPNQVVKMETFGNYVRSSTENSAKLERDTTEVVENIANTAFEDIEGTQVALSAGEYIVQLKVDTEGLPTGNYVFDFAGFHYEGGEQFIEQRITVDNSGTYTITLHDDIQSGAGVATMLYIGRVFNVSSEITQKADNIMLQVNGKVSQSDFNIFSDSIQSSVKSISPSKNLLKGSLSAKGWLSSPSDVVASGVPYTSAKLDDDGYIVTNGNDQYLAQKLTLSGGKTYALSFYSKKTTVVTVTVWVVDYPTMKQTFTVAATGVSDRKTAKIEVSPYLGGYMGISINATNIKQPQLEEGDTATDFIADSAEISSGIIQTADNIQLFVTQGLSNTGIDITNGTIKLQANKVTFCDANGGNTDKIWIDSTNGTLHAVNGHFSGEITATSGSITGQMNIASGGSIIVGKEDSYRIKIAQSSNRGYITMLDGDSNNIILINYDTGKNAGQIKVSEADAQHERNTFINPYSMESVYNYKNASGQWNGDYSHITTQVGRRMAETEYDDLYVSGGFGTRRHIKIGVGTTGSGSSEQSVVNLRAYNDNQESAWPVCSLDPNGANWMDKGHVHVMTMGELKVLLNNPNSIYSSHLANYAVMLTRINGN